MIGLTVWLLFTSHAIAMIVHIERHQLHRATWAQLYGSVWTNHRRHHDYPKAVVR